MDHSHMGHGDMDMGHGGGHDEMMCSMNMLFTWNTENLCIVFRSWRVTDAWSLIFSLIAVAALTAGYEAVREASRRYEARHETYMAGLTNAASAPVVEGAESYRDDPPHTTTTNEGGSLLAVRPGNSAAAEEKRGKVVKAALYGIQVFYSFFIMLLFMTYNGWIMLAVGFGAFAGYLVFGGGASSTKSAACH